MNGSVRWFSANADKAWAEKFFLLYSPVWMAVMGAVQLGGWFKQWSDPAFMVYGLAVMAPLLVVPALARRSSGIAWHRSYWLRFNLWIWIFVYFGSYVGSHYFFDVLGMRYRFPTTWNLDAALVGSDKGEVPFFLYPVTQAYFVTYHTLMVVLLRRLRTGLRPGRATTALAVVALSYAVAWAETFFMANELISDTFEYLDLPRMLRYGSLFYASYFVVSLPMVYRLDEDETEPQWPLGRVAVESLAAGMLVFFLLDAWAMIIGPL